MVLKISENTLPSNKKLKFRYFRFKNKLLRKYRVSANSSVECNILWIIRISHIELFFEMAKYDFANF